MDRRRETDSKGRCPIVCDRTSPVHDRHLASRHAARQSAAPAVIWGRADFLPASGAKPVAEGFVVRGGGFLGAAACTEGEGQEALHAVKAAWEGAPHVSHQWTF